MLGHLIHGVARSHPVIGRRNPRQASGAEDDAKVSAPPSMWQGFIAPTRDLQDPMAAHHAPAGAENGPPRRLGFSQG